MASKNKKKTLIRLNSTESGYFKIKQITPGTAQRKLEFRKYDPVVRKHVLFKQHKVT